MARRRGSTRPDRPAGTCSFRPRRSRRRALRGRPGTRRANGRHRAARARPPHARQRRSPGSSGMTWPVWNITCDSTTRSAPGAIAASTSAAANRPSASGSTKASVGAPAPRVLAQDHIERIELAARGDDARDAVARIEHGAQALPRARLRHDAIGTRRSGERGEPRAERGHLRAPVVPRVAQPGIPERRALRAHRLPSRRAAGRANGWRDRCARAARAATREKSGAMCSRTNASVSGPDPGGNARCIVMRSAAGPMNVRTSISSGKNA